MQKAFLLSVNSAQFPLSYLNRIPSTSNFEVVFLFSWSEGRGGTRGAIFNTRKQKQKQSKKIKKKHTFLLKSYSMLVGKSEYLDDSGTVIYNF